ncbi:MerR family transcriptional regulator [Thiogranum longum]|uniref:MerR family transcriptional regulator n=1 Tax=Thiogranum longum TaxID=1537524 RepID=UPI0014033E25|nr:MerR family transcriptional regulator [Thiogranum longum]
MTQDSFTRLQATAITGLSARQLGYWRKTGLVAPAARTRGGHARYTFTDLIALRAAKRLLDASISLQRIRKCLQSLTHFLPTADQPLVELSLVVTGDVVLVFHGERAFDALTGQEWVFPIAELVKEVEQLQRIQPQQGELFPAATEKPEKYA